MGKPQKTRARPTGRARDAALPDLSRFGQLAEYNRKRHFGITPEPPGTTKAREPGRPREFVIQKHRATRLHYDFRLEHRGAMLSWAVPKGPSLDPAVKRLAMETEPHPIDYNQFEGVIPEGEYGGGTVMIWDKGVWAPDAGGRLGDEQDVDRQLKKGDLKFVLLGQKLAGSWVLVRSRDTRQWLLIKHRDEHVTDEDPTISKPLSVVSGRTMTEIAIAAGATARQVEQAAGTDPERELARVARNVRPRAARTTRSGAAKTPVKPTSRGARSRGRAERA
jgi:bifunctional non-homologous end joining protein LigD